MERYCETMYQVLFPNMPLGGHLQRKPERVNVPMIRPIDENSPELNNEEASFFRKGLGMCGWVALVLRYDACLAFSRIGQFAAKPNQSALHALTHLVHYLYYSRTLCLRQSNDAPGRFRVQSDSDLAGNSSFVNRMRSQMSWIVEVDRALIIFASKVNPTVGSTVANWEFRPAVAHAKLGSSHPDLSSASVELYAAANCVNDTLALTYVLDEAGIVFALPIEIEIDNAAAVAFISHRGAGKSNLRHIDLRLSWIKTLHDSCIVQPVKVPTRHNMSDLGTKILDHQRLIWLRSRWYHIFPMFNGPDKLEYDEVLDSTPHIDHVRELAEQELHELMMFTAALRDSALGSTGDNC